MKLCDKIILLRKQKGWSQEDFLLKEDNEPETTIEEATMNETKKETPKRRVSRTEAESFLSIRKDAATSIANGVRLCIISPALMMALIGFSQDTRIGLNENIAVADM